MSNPVTGPDDDERYGHGGVEVPMDDLDGLPQQATAGDGELNDQEVTLDGLATDDRLEIDDGHA